MLTAAVSVRVNFPSLPTAVRETLTQVSAKTGLKQGQNSENQY